MTREAGEIRDALSECAMALSMYRVPCGCAALKTQGEEA